MNSEPSQRVLHEAASRGLRALAADERCRSAFTAPGSVLQDILSPAARRYVLAADRDEFLGHLAVLREKSYGITVEFVGEENSDPAQIEQVVQEYLSVLAHDPVPGQLGFDLSNVGLTVSRELALENSARIVEAAAAKGCEVVLSMERSCGRRRGARRVSGPRRAVRERRHHPPGPSVPERAGHRGGRQAGPPRAPRQGRLPGSRPMSPSAAVRRSTPATSASRSSSSTRVSG